MVSHTGSARLALFLFCCLGPFLSCRTAPTYTPEPYDQRGIIEELKISFKELLDNYLQDEKGVPKSSQYEMPCFTADPRPPHYLDSSAILPYFRAIQPILNNQTLDVVIEHLDKLEFQRAPKTNVSVPTDQFEQKRFILTILKQFSNCLNSDLVSKLFQ
ncbi:interleukin-31 [Vicugna pacos]|uniref:Interleukin-31 n=1 Tax=Vicugna pacos TaxID=30538 RepID=A0ABM5CKU7_VICPA